MRYPKNIQQGGTIGFVAPSFGCQIEPYYSAFGNAQKKFREMGYQLQLGPNCYAGEGIGISNTPEKCGQELTEYYCSRENDCLISCGGGELMCETMSHVDFERLKAAEPKWYLGYSDNTNMTYLLATICDTLRSGIRYGTLAFVVNGCIRPAEGRDEGSTRLRQVGKGISEKQGTSAITLQHDRTKSIEKLFGQTGSRRRTENSIFRKTFRWMHGLSGEFIGHPV